MRHYGTASRVPYPKHYVMRPFPLCGVRVLHHAQMIYNSFASCDRPPTKRNKKTVPWLSSLRSERHVLQCRAVANLRQSDLYLVYTIHTGGREYYFFFIALVFRPLTTHPLRVEAPFLLLLETPPTFRRSLRCFHTLLLLTLSPLPCCAARGHHQYILG